MTYSDMNEKAVAFGESHLRTVIEPEIVKASAEFKRLTLIAPSEIKPGKPNARTGKTKRDLHDDKIEKADKLLKKWWSIGGSLHESIGKLKDPFETWPTLDVSDRKALEAHHRAAIAKITGVKTFL